MRQLYTDDVTGLFAAVMAAPGEKLPQLVLADALDECGEHDTAHAFRWCAAHGRVPFSTTGPAVSRWHGWRRGAYNSPRDTPGPSYLPKPLAAAMRIGIEGQWRVNPWLCYHELAGGLVTLAWLAALPPDDPTPEPE